MSSWSGKHIIGLTGNIATGKSVVRKMLEHLGAYGIDADALSHRAITKGAPGFQKVVDTFGRWVLSSDGQIDRKKLARIVFAAPKALATLEGIVHPLVSGAVDMLVRRASQKVIVVEAIKLLESDLRASCNSIWVTFAPEEFQMVRLMKKRGMSESSARRRINAQSPQKLKVDVADVVIHNTGTFEETWRLVVDAWKEHFPLTDTGPVQPEKKKVGAFAVQRATPRQAEEIASVITRLSQGQRQLTRLDVMASFGEKAFLLLSSDEKTVGLLGWQVENLVARIDDVYMESDIPLGKAMQAIIKEVERASNELQCEAALLFLPPEMAEQGAVRKTLDYKQLTIDELGVRAWQEAAKESMPPGTVMLFKQLRKDRVLRPV